MTDLTKISPLSAENYPGLAGRYRAERRFQFLGRLAIALSLGFLAFLILSITYLGSGAFFKTEIRFDLNPALSNEVTDDSYSLLRKIVLSEPGISGRGARKAFFRLIGADAEDVVRRQIIDRRLVDHRITSIWLPASDEVDMAVKAGLEEGGLSRLGPQQLDRVRMLAGDGRIQTRFNMGFLLNGDSRDAERAGVGGALIGSLFTLVICFLLSFFVGVMAAIYLEEFAPKNRWTAFIEVNINNLASVPSIIFGLLGLALFLNIFGLPRSSSLVGGMVLALMTLPTIIIASRVSLQSVPPSVREAALGLGATRIQMVFHHVVPLALPGMLTGAILGMARALGETAPLMMIGMVAFIADPPGSFTDPATAMPVQVFLWSDSPERAFAEKAAGAIIVLILFLILMNLAAVLLRKKFEKKW
ncbi:Phosphate transport system permease protein PstA (TC 3.A.1.7.1) [hydrothermal vent metagenome]|uniref:Phosphate transport system permease protein PstA (TC 3.A.1.7.1) n=1 Tax=hydrothermal vent metagenome TaxID=652676 RepID=A0A3B0RI10_9ZZZZ